MCLSDHDPKHNFIFTTEESVYASEVSHNLLQDYCASFPTMLFSDAKMVLLRFNAFGLFVTL